MCFLAMDINEILLFFMLADLAANIIDNLFLCLFAFQMFTVKEYKEKDTNVPELSYTIDVICILIIKLKKYASVVKSRIKNSLLLKLLSSDSRTSNIPRPQCYHQLESKSSNIFVVLIRNNYNKPPNGDNYQNSPSYTNPIVFNLSNTPTFLEPLLLFPDAHSLLTPSYTQYVLHIKVHTPGRQIVTIAAESLGFEKSIDRTYWHFQTAGDLKVESLFNPHCRFRKESRGAFRHPINVTLLYEFRAKIAGLRLYDYWLLTDLNSVTDASSAPKPPIILYPEDSRPFLASDRTKLGYFFLTELFSEARKISFYNPPSRKLNGGGEKPQVKKAILLQMV
ncbi:hypothetical protein G9A89_014342 [Geosiphon pyriformis]|nr:hypothetical protein G9A89_014342 [Geosiphon pyriformis]